jgi:two-component system, NtrC family, response regulator AtoC
MVRALLNEVDVPQRLLIADDEKAILFAMRDYFDALGYEVDCAQDSECALSLLEAHRYAVVIADLRLTKSAPAEGLDLLMRVRARWPATRTIILTAYGSAEMEARARGIGVDAVLQKSERLTDVAKIVRWLSEGGPQSSS